MPLETCGPGGQLKLTSEGKLRICGCCVLPDTPCCLYGQGLIGAVPLFITVLGVPLRFHSDEERYRPISGDGSPRVNRGSDWALFNGDGGQPFLSPCLFGTYTRGDETIIVEDDFPDILHYSGPTSGSIARISDCRWGSGGAGAQLAYVTPSPGATKRFALCLDHYVGIFLGPQDGPTGVYGGVVTVSA